MPEPVGDYVITPHAAAVRPGRDVLQSRIDVGGKTYLVRAFVDVDREPVEVVTVYRTSKIEKYWRNGL